MRTRTLIAPAALAALAASLATPAVAYADLAPGPQVAIGIGIELVFGIVLVAICVAVGIVLLRFLRKREAARMGPRDYVSPPAETPAVGAPAGPPPAEQPAAQPPAGPEDPQ